ncbi:MAG TPA: DNA-3-methyladenine glycosylase [Gaiellaceae bacterium]|nr:DNA-3-methyladenine glycosylase [Gaiellaceae bacterium]
MRSHAPGTDLGSDPAGLTRRVEASAVSRDFFARDVCEVGYDLVGATLLVEGVGGIVVETEAYGPGDPASHSFSGPTRRNRTMFGPPGHLYVYRAYGIHWCVNVTCEADGVGAAVLLRALEPTRGLEVMRARRGTDDVRLLCSGPGRLTQALGITSAHDGHPVDAPPVVVRPAARADVVAGPRIGISRATRHPWRYALRGSAFVSRPRPRP